MTNLEKAYTLGCKLALYKFSEDSGKSADNLTKALESILDKKPIPEAASVLDNSERASSSSSWGDKIELETPTNTGINV